MSPEYAYWDAINLLVAVRITADDAARQMRTAREVLARLGSQLGVVLADEVGMGKTFVARAVATSVALRDSQQRPVVVMVPASLKDKWPRDHALFRERCATDVGSRRLIARGADSAVAFLKLLDSTKQLRTVRARSTTRGSIQALAKGRLCAWAGSTEGRRPCGARCNATSCRATGRHATSRSGGRLRLRPGRLGRCRPRPLWSLRGTGRRSMPCAARRMRSSRG